MGEIDWNAGGNTTAADWRNAFNDRQARMERRAAAPDIAPALAGDKEALGRVAAASPDIAMKLAVTVANMDVRRQTQARAQMDMAGRLAASVLGAPPEQQGAAYAQALTQARALGMDTSAWPQEWSPATKAFVSHQAQLLGTASQLFKRIGASGAPAAGGGGGGWTNPAVPGVRTSDATPPDAPPTSVAALPQPAPPPVVAQTPPPRPTAAPTVAAGVPNAPAGPTMARATPAPGAPPVRPGAPPVGPRGDDLQDTEYGGAIAAAPPGPPQIAPRQMAGAPPPDDSGGEGDFVPPDRVVGGQGRFTGLPSGAEVKVDAKGHPIELGGRAWVRLPGQNGKPGELGLWDPAARKTFVAQDAGDKIHLLDMETGQTVRTIPKGAAPRQTPTITEGPVSQGPNPDIESVRGLQVPAGWRVALYDGQLHVKDGAVEIIGPNKERSMIPLPARADPALKVRPLPQASIEKLGSAGSSAQEFTGLRDTFDDSFGGFRSGFMGGLDNLRKRNLPDSLGGEDPKGQVEWWSRYQDQKNLIRHTLFGSALTATEKAEFDKANIDPGMKPDKIRANLARQADAAMRAAAKLAGALLASGYSRESVESAIGLPLDSLPSATAKPLADTPKGAPASGGGAPPSASDKPVRIYDPKSGSFQ